MNERDVIVRLLKLVLYSQRSLSHTLLRLGTDSLVLMMNVRKGKGGVWVGKINHRTKLDDWRKRER